MILKSIMKEAWPETVMLLFCDRKKSQAAVFLGVPAPECKRRVKEAMDRVALQAERRIAIFDGHVREVME